MCTVWIARAYTGIKPTHLASIFIRIIPGTILLPQGGFSPNGNTFARFDQFHGITALDFSRCTGRLSNARFYPVDSTLSSTSLAFSPNSRFIYYNNSRQLMQLDTRADPGEYAVDTIAQWDGYYDSAPPFTSGFGFSQLAPDGKIYMTVTATGRFMHVIERPDLPGQACGFRQHGFPLPTFNGSTIPHFPNYRLEAIDCN